MFSRINQRPRGPEGSRSAGEPEVAAPPLSTPPSFPGKEGRTAARSPRVDASVLALRAGLPGRSIRAVQTLVNNGSSLADLDWIAHGRYDCKPPSLYVLPDGSTTDRGDQKINKSKVKKNIIDGGNMALGLIRATIGLDYQPQDYFHRKRRERRISLDPFEGMQPADVVELAQRFRVENPDGRQTPARSESPAR